MSWKRLALLPLLMVLASCSMDGGSSGTGITTAEGNVVGIQRDPMLGSAVMASTRTAVEDIQVVVEGTDAASDTDSDGRFVVRGRFDGRVTLLFRRADDSLTARVAISIPAGGTMTLHDVQIELAQEQAIAASQDVVFDALVASTDCASPAISLVSLTNPDSSDPYTLHLQTSSLRDRHGNLLACGDVQDGDRVHVQGAAYRDGTFGGAEVQVDR
jgi:hypothetical protein